MGDSRTHRLLELFDGGIARNGDRELEVARTLDVERELLCCCLFCHVAASLLRCTRNEMTESSAWRCHRVTSFCLPSIARPSHVFDRNLGHLHRRLNY